MLNYDDISLACENLTYRDKLRLAQLLIQLARKEEEESHPDKRIQVTDDVIMYNEETIGYVIDRILKSKPQKSVSLLNFIKSMHQFKGGISDFDAEKFMSELQSRKIIKIDGVKITYL